MKIFAARHPFMKDKVVIEAPEALSDLLSAVCGNFLSEAAHLGFSRAGHLLYWTENLPAFLRDFLPVDGIDVFFMEMRNWADPKGKKILDVFRPKLLSETRADIAFSVVRCGLIPAGMVGFFSLKQADRFHFTLVGPGGIKPDSDEILNSSLFSDDSVFQSKIDVWLKSLDNDLLERMAMEVFHDDIPESSIPGLVIRSVENPDKNLVDGSDCAQDFVTLKDNPALFRWWGTVIEEIDQSRNYWIHTVVRCGRVLPVLTVSADIHALKKIGVFPLRKVLTRMSGRILEVAQAFTWSPKYRYVNDWLEPKGYDIKKAGEIIECIVQESKDVMILPIQSSVRTLPEVFRKSRLDEPYFWDSDHEMVYVVLRNTTMENAERIVSPSIALRMALPVGAPMSLESFIMKCRMNGGGKSQNQE
ncbi:MAG: hypothetical protein ACYC9S_06280 [Leptospirales bacterium]